MAQPLAHMSETAALGTTRLSTRRLTTVTLRVTPVAAEVGARRWANDTQGDRCPDVGMEPPCFMRDSNDEGRARGATTLMYCTSVTAVGYRRTIDSSKQDYYDLRYTNPSGRSACAGGRGDAHPPRSTPVDFAQPPQSRQNRSERAHSRLNRYRGKKLCRVRIRSARRHWRLSCRGIDARDRRHVSNVGLASL